MARPVVLVAPDKFRGSLSAPAAAAALARGVRAAHPDAEVLTRPVADGGEGTVEAFLGRGWSAERTGCTGPTGAPVPARWARQGERAVVELAECCGLQRLPNGTPAPRTATSRGAGEVLAAALRAGAREVVLGVGGSASSDGGLGLLAALGVRVRDADGVVLPAEPSSLQHATTVDVAEVLPALRGARILVATDVTNPLVGPDGAAAVFGPQKGADPADVDWLAAGLEHWATVLGGDAGTRPGGGAAGGVPAGMLGALGDLATVEVVSGAATVVDLVGIRDLVGRCDLVLSGEGSFDRQSLAGKAPVEVVRAAVGAGAEVGLVAGRLDVPAADLGAIGVRHARSLVATAEGGEDPFRDAATLVTRAALGITRAVLG